MGFEVWDYIETYLVVCQHDLGRRLRQAAGLPALIIIAGLHSGAGTLPDALVAINIARVKVENLPRPIMPRAILYRGDLEIFIPLVTQDSRLVMLPLLA